MPVLKTPPVTHGKSFLVSSYWVSIKFPIALKAFSPYTMSQYHSSRLQQSPCVKICAPYIDGDYPSPDFVPYDGYNGKFDHTHSLSPVSSHLLTDIRVSSFSQRMDAGPLFTEADIYELGTFFLFLEPQISRPHFIPLAGYHEQCPPSFSSPPSNGTGAVYGLSTFT
ncbi:hypothetical protein BYT27DRAFT_6712820 [Phlegmacium glaucopus]|nr:hypothetical protein BYT27DRAFT_6712820 [Phlegmacium glaucopus]